MFPHKYKIKYPQKFFLTFVGILFLDQLIKNILFVTERFQRNYDALFAFKASSFWSGAALLLFLALLFHSKEERIQKFTLPLSLMISGIASNAIDRVRFGFIIDYINFFDLFIFNLADVAILAGTAISIWKIMKE